MQTLLYARTHGDYSLSVKCRRIGPTRQAIHKYSYRKVVLFHKSENRERGLLFCRNNFCSKDIFIVSAWVAFGSGYFGWTLRKGLEHLQSFA